MYDQLKLKLFGVGCQEHNLLPNMAHGWTKNLSNDPPMKSAEPKIYLATSKIITSESPCKNCLSQSSMQNLLAVTTVNTWPDRAWKRDLKTSANVRACHRNNLEFCWHCVTTGKPSEICHLLALLAAINLLIAYHNLTILSSLWYSLNV